MVQRREKLFFGRFIVGIVNKTSETAMIMASLRALATYESDLNLRVQDNLAELFLPTDRKTSLNDENGRSTVKQAIPKGLYEYVIARTKYFDEVFTKALSDEIPQIVFLGAGYDSRPYRFREMLGETRIYEMDAVSTQTHKLEILRTNGIGIPQNVNYVPINFETEDLVSTLLNAGVDPLQETLFLWEGVTFYLSFRAVVQILQSLKNNFKKYPRLCFDFQTVSANQELIDTGLKNETIKFGIKSGEIDEFVKDNGYHVVDYLDFENMEERYLLMVNGNKYGSIAPMMNFLLIESD
jgi:methyltransferase (TIGR00027 family)